MSARSSESESPEEATTPSHGPYLKYTYSVVDESKLRMITTNVSLL